VTDAEHKERARPLHPEAEKRKRIKRVKNKGMPMAGDSAKLRADDGRACGWMMGRQGSDFIFHSFFFFPKRVRVV
jgi:hypothetical protein